jgi:hypothetical protein
MPEAEASEPKSSPRYEIISDDETETESITDDDVVLPQLSVTLDAMLFGTASYETFERAEDRWYVEAVLIGQQAWADRTRSERQRVWNHFRQFAQRLARVKDRAYTYEEVALVFLQSHEQTLPSTRLQYAKILHNLLRRFGESTAALHCYMAGLRNSGALVPTTVAASASPTQIRFLLTTNDSRMVAAISLAWRTASRWSDLADLRRSNFLLITDRRIILRWGRTKSHRTGTATMSSLTVVDSVEPMTELTGHINSLRSTDLFCPFSADTFRAVLRRHTSTDNLTAHSLKNGAAELLCHHALFGRVRQDLIPRLTKHSSPLQQQFPTITLHYLHNEVDRALLLETQLVTVWLDPRRQENL